MGKARNKDNILVDMYNLNLTGNPDLDKDKFIDFLNKYAPQATRYLNAKEIKNGPVDFGGTLGWFEHIQKESWFKCGYRLYYDWIYRGIVLPVVNTYLSNQEPDEILKDMVGSLINNIRSRLDYDTKNHLFREKKTYTFDIAKGELALAGVEYGLFQEIISLWNRKIEIRKCSASDCENIYIPSHRGRTQEFCSNRCLKRTRMREIRKKQKKVVVLA